MGIRAANLLQSTYLLYSITKAELSQPQSSITDPITPPLLPRSPSPIPYEPSSETGQLDLLSDQPSPTRQQVEALDEALIEKDSLVLLKSQIEPGDDGPEAAASNLTSVGGIYSPLKEISSTPSPRLWERSRKQDLKVDGPLTPPASDRPPPWDKKKVSFSEALHGIIPHLPPPMPEPERISDEDIEMLFAEHFEPTAARAERAIEQEQLKEADTTSRVPVPIMDFAKPTPPWHIAPSGTLDEWKRIVLSDLKEAYLDFPPWLQEGQSKKALSWVPFPMSKGRFELQETIEDDGSLAALVTAPEPLDPEILSWKPPGLRIFDKTHSSDEEELERGVFSPAGDVHSLVKERILEMQDGEERGNAPGCAQNLKDIKEQLANGPELRREELHSEEHQAEQSTGGYSAPMPGFSAINALDQFLSIRKGEIGRNNKLAKIHASTPTPHALLDTSEPRKPADINVAEQSTLPVPRPKITIPNKQCYYVASTGFLSNRRLAHQIKDLYPSAEMIERDFTIYALHSPHAEKNVHTARTGPEAPLDEADLILSPSTGLIITSLQKIKQQSLPGQATCSPIRERIQRTAARYERLIVLVSINSASSTDGASIRSHLEESDCEAIVSLTAFLNHLQGLSENDLILVDGGTTVLATWIVSLMVRYSSEVAITLLQDETQWEVFLRQAGMNAFAAQVVIAKLKAMQGSDGRPLGLRDLTLMDAEERYRRFEGLLCGRGLLERVGRVLDACW